MQVFVDGFALFETEESAVLPQYGRGVGQRAGQPLVTALKRAVAKLHAFVEDFPELIYVFVRGQTDIDEVDGDHALIESAVVLGLAVFVDVGGEERAAAHAGVAVTLAVLVNLVLQHYLFGNVVGYHALCRAFRRQYREVVVGVALVNVVVFEDVDELGERRRDPHALFVLYALMPLAQNLLDNHREVVLFLLVFGFVEVHEHGDERRLTVGGKQRHYLILYRLDAPANFVAQAFFGDFRDFVLGSINAQLLDFRDNLAADFLTADLHEGREMRQRNRLAAVLIGRDLRDNLRGDVAGGGEAVRTLYHRAGNDRAVL